jgi:hypothetical protein
MRRISLLVALRGEVHDLEETWDAIFRIDPQAKES